MRHFLIIIYTILGLHSFSIAQNTDSLWNVWQDKSQTDSTRFYALGDLYFAVSKTNVDSALKIARLHRSYAWQVKDTGEAMFASLNIGYSLGEEQKYEEAIKIYKEIQSIQTKRKKWKALCTLQNNLGYMYLRTGESKKAEEAYLKGEKYALHEKDTMSLYRYYNQLAIIHDDHGELAAALDYYFKAIKLAEKQENKWALSVFLMNAGTIYSKLGDKEREEEYMNKSLQLKREVGDVEGEVQLSLNLAGNKIENNDFKEAYNLINNLLSKCKTQECKTSTYGGIYAVWGHYYAQQNLLDSAVENYRLSCERFLEAHEYEKYTRVAPNYAEILRSLGKQKEALRICKEVLVQSRKLNHLNGERLACKCLYKSYEDLGNKAEAYEYYKTYIEIRDSLNSVETAKLAEKKALDHEYEMKQISDSIRIAQERHEEALAYEHKLTIQRSYTYGGIAGALLMVVIAVVSIRAYGAKKKANQELEDKNTQITSQKIILEEKNKEITDSISYAKRIQEAILPPKQIVQSWLPSSFILYKPKDIVAGDFYWMETIGDTVFFAAADCTGHGVPGAMVSVVCANALTKGLVEEHITDLGRLLGRTREIVIDQFGRSEEEIKDGMDIAICALNTKTRQLHYAGANNPLWIVRKGADTVEEIKADKQPIGSYTIEKPFTSHQVQLNEGDSIYIFSDGYQDQFGGKNGKKYKSGHMKTFIISLQGKDMQMQRELFNKEFESWRGDMEQIDDVCVIGVRV